MNEQKRKEEIEREAAILYHPDESKSLDANVRLEIERLAFKIGATFAKKFERETAIEFYNWRLENEYEIDVREQREHTDDELFTIFLNSKNQEK